MKGSRTPTPLERHGGPQLRKKPSPQRNRPEGAAALAEGERSGKLQEFEEKTGTFRAAGKKARPMSTLDPHGAAIHDLENLRLSGPPSPLARRKSSGVGRRQSPPSELEPLSLTPTRESSHSDELDHHAPKPGHEEPEPLQMPGTSATEPQDR
jgi:hypothetical protein